MNADAGITANVSELDGILTKKRNKKQPCTVSHMHVL